MCWKCDNKATTTAYLTMVQGKIYDYGWYIQLIEKDGTHPPWAYTVGLTALERPELVLTGMSPTQAAVLLNAEAAYRAHIDEPTTPRQFRLRDGPLVEVVTVAEPSAHLHIATALYGDTVKAIQLVHADRRGHWPWQAGYRGLRGGQPVLGVRS